ncbi:MAG: hypothetical protein CBB65_01445 [Hyphomonadaceae bacterium TMED5]|nr:hypothetical protein [Ponticaulis sp.]OUY01132.1 MAG: hypothetical protein CBB65_01445 [Hyphomonadaceae bacterium TMED5]|tara:strand:- start:135299 stop:135706 length:408 start_codon:yes stop_codon:yes gene_type:complete
MDSMPNKILYLEDDAHISEIAIMALEDFSDFNVRHCSHGSMAIETFRAYQPDLLLFDVMLPDIDGVETLRRIRQLPGGEHIPVIFMTAKVQKHEQQAYMDLGALSVIVKPFDALNLGDQIKSIWSARQTPSVLST